MRESFQPSSRVFCISGQIAWSLLNMVIIIINLLHFFYQLTAYYNNTQAMNSLILLALIVISGSALYCQPYNCYELLQISQSATNEEVKKAFRLMARRHHPDKNKKQDTTELFQKINQAYQILDNQHTRKAYDYYLSDPTGSRAYHAYQFYKASYSPQTNPFLVLAIFVLLLSWLQWVMRKQMYSTAIDRIVESEEFRKKVNEECFTAGKKGDKRYKQQVARKLQKEISIEGGYSEPKVIDLLAFRLVVFPYTFVMYIVWWVQWIFNYYIMRREYKRQDQEYLTKRALKIPVAKWQSMGEGEKRGLLERRLWVKKNMQSYWKQMQERQLQQIRETNPAKYRKIMSYLKKNG